MMLEDEVDQLIQIEASKHACVLLRNNSGAMQDQTGRVVRYGLGHVSKEQNKKFKSSDRIACMPVLITPAMVGTVIGVFVAVEIKKEKWTFNPKDEREQAQMTFINWILARGGYAGFANSVDSFLKIIRK